MPELELGALALWGVSVCGVLYSVVWGTSSRTPPVVDSHCPYCSCDSELRRIIELQDSIDYWKRLAFIAGAVAFVCVISCLCGLFAGRGCWCILPLCRRNGSSRARSDVGDLDTRCFSASEVSAARRDDLARDGDPGPLRRGGVLIVTYRV